MKINKLKILLVTAIGFGFMASWTENQCMEERWQDLLPRPQPRNYSSETMRERVIKLWDFRIVMASNYSEKIQAPDLSYGELGAILGDLERFFNPDSLILEMLYLSEELSGVQSCYDYHKQDIVQSYGIIKQYQGNYNNRMLTAQSFKLKLESKKVDTPIREGLLALVRSEINESRTICTIFRM